MGSAGPRCGRSRGRGPGGERRRPRGWPPLAAVARLARGWTAGAALAAASLLPVALAQTESQVTLSRKDTTIVVTLKAQYANGARFIGNNPNCVDGVRQTLLYGPDPGYVDTRVGEDTELRSNVALVRSPEAGSGKGGSAPAGTSGGGAQSGTASGGSQPAGETGGAAPSGAEGGGGGSAGAGAGSAGAGGESAGAGAGSAGAGAGGTPATGAGAPAKGGAPSGNGAAAPTSGAESSSNPAEQQTLELFDGTVTVSRAGCIDTEDRITEPSVTLIQGRTTVKGTHFFLDQGKDVGTMDGPIQLDRAASGDSPGLKATADNMTFDTQTRHTTLTGSVRVTSNDRVTTADTLDLDEAAGVAVLTGSPAKSVKGEDVLQGSKLRYYLNTNDVVVLGNVQGDLQVSGP